MMKTSDAPYHLFILSPPYSGSTLLWKILGSSPTVSSLPGEGQSLPETRELLRPLAWKEDVNVPWDDIIPHWESYWDMNKPILLEKSPPHLLRAKDLVEHFSNTRFVALVCEPYATAESLMRRNSWDASTAIKFWCRTVSSLQHTIEMYKGTQLTYISYEELCDNPAHSCRRLLSFLPELEELNWNQRFKLHSFDRSVIQGIRDLSADKRARLSTQDRYSIQATLSKHRDVLRYYGYELECPRDIEDTQELQSIS